MRSFASKISFPSAYAILMLVIVLGAVLTWMLPAGRYDLLRYDQANRTFVVQSATGEETLPAEQETLERLGIQIQIEHFEKGNIRKAVSISGTYHIVRANPQGVIAILKAPVLGTYEAIDVILFVLVIGGFIGVFQKTGAFDAGLNAVVLRLRGREAWLIIIATALISLGGTTFGMAEETLAFYPLLVLGAKVNARDRARSTALHWAAQRGETKIALLLLSYRAAVNLQDEFGETPLI